MRLTRKMHFCLAIALGSAPGWAVVSPVAAIRFSLDNRWVALAGGETVRIVSPERNEIAFELPSKLAQVMDAAWSPDSKTLAVGGGNAGRNGGIELWNPGERRLVQADNPFRDLVYAVAFAPDGKRLVAAGAEGIIRIIDLPGGQTPGTLDRALGSRALRGLVARRKLDCKRQRGSFDSNLGGFNREDGTLAQ